MRWPKQESWPSTHAEVVGLGGEEQLESIEIKQKSTDNKTIAVAMVALFGLSPKLDPLPTGGWRLKNAIKVDNTLDYQTNIPGIFAIGDVNTYPESRVILCGFHEATLAIQLLIKSFTPTNDSS